MVFGDSSRSGGVPVKVGGGVDKRYFVVGEGAEETVGGRDTGVGGTEDQDFGHVGVVFGLIGCFVILSFGSRGSEALYTYPVCAIAQLAGA